MIQRIVVPLDGSEESRAALPYAEAISRATGAAIELLAVIERERTGFTGVPAETAARLEAVRRRALGDQVANVREELAGRGFTAATALPVGDPVQEIIVAAERPEDAIIVMATHGRGGMERWLIGSVADKVMRLATRPVLMVPVPEGDGPARIGRLMTPLDGSEAAEAALPLAGELAAALGAELLIVRVERPLALSAPDAGFLPEIGRIEEEAVSAARSYLDHQRAGLPGGVRVETAALLGSPADVLVRLAREKQVDLVVMTSHGRGGLRRLLLGSIADRLIRSEIPALVVRPPRSAEDAIDEIGAAPP